MMGFMETIIVFLYAFLIATVLIAIATVVLPLFVVGQIIYGFQTYRYEGRFRLL